MVFMSVLLVCTAPVAADDDGDKAKGELKKQMKDVGNFLAAVIAFVAVPNGAFGVFQYMTAGTDTEQSDKGRTRIRNSFIGVAGAAAVVTAVRFLTGLLGVGLS
ncbi:hypothetical protein C440_06602 [Haloferax mucosum ATCC BAA-1512]|uniref:Uncharacterized protein n=2 Tax=Haloferax mucosum TaxID=403181 RepID=M0IKF3_9EURY|nr:hypothetical protein C440_06602 [Haloferax mucosum ATCC BAA-1512]